MFETLEADIVKPYGPWMRAPFRKQVKPVGANWLRSGIDGGDRNSNAIEFLAQYSGGGSSSNDPLFSLQNYEVAGKGWIFGDNDFQKIQTSGIVDYKV